MSSSINGQRKKRGPSVLGWSDAAMFRLKEAVQRKGNQADVARAAGIARETLTGIFGQKRSVPSQITLEKICEVVGVEPDFVMSGAPSKLAVSDERTPFTHFPATDVVRVPIHDVTVSAGGGVVALEKETPVGLISFPKTFLRPLGSDLGELRIVQVVGDSMEPTLRDGALLMFQPKDVRPRDGIFIIREGDQLRAKRLMFLGQDEVRVCSDNDAYARGDRTVQLSQKDRAEFAIIGRAVWTGQPL